jgi:hypothetical protein
MVRKSPQQEADEYVDRLVAVTNWLGIRVEQYPAWTVAALEREFALMNKLARPFRNRGDEKAAALLKQIDVRSAHLRRLIQHWSNVAARPLDAWNLTQDRRSTSKWSGSPLLPSALP